MLQQGQIPDGIPLGDPWCQALIEVVADLILLLGIEALEVCLSLLDVVCQGSTK